MMARKWWISPHLTFPVCRFTRPSQPSSTNSYSHGRLRASRLAKACKTLTRTQRSRLSLLSRRHLFRLHLTKGFHKMHLAFAISYAVPSIVSHTSTTSRARCLLLVKLRPRQSKLGGCLKTVWSRIWCLEKQASLWIWSLKKLWAGKHARPTTSVTRYQRHLKINILQLWWRSCLLRKWSKNAAKTIQKIATAKDSKRKTLPRERSGWSLRESANYSRPSSSATTSRTLSGAATRFWSWRRH